ncbi:EAL domain-containing protein [Paracoccus litorisediminis]|nr:EAL domain-containing protein [Paracoccus litorisediminis]
MVLGIGTAVERLRQAMRLPIALMTGASRSVLVLRLVEGEALRRRLGPALFERMLDHVMLRLTIELGLNPQARRPGQTEISGLLSTRADATLPQRVALLGRICADSVDLGEMPVAIRAEGVIVRGDMASDPARMIDFGRAALASAGQGGPIETIRILSYLPDQPFRPMISSIEATPHIEPRFQPQICCDTGRLIALDVEGWRIEGDLPPTPLDQIAPSLNDEGCSALVLATLRQALSALCGWDRDGHDIPFLSLRLPERALSDPALAESILWELDRQDLSPDRIEIVFCEPIGTGAKGQAAKDNLQRLAAGGCRMAVGDFGTGSAGLADLRGFGVKRVRIGRAFVDGCHHRGDQQRMILAILALAENLRLEVLADEVAVLDERAFLSQIGFSAVQGSAVAPAMEADAIEPFLLSHRHSLPRALPLGRGR